MTLFWVIAGAALVVALVAWGQARRTARRLEQLSQMYWELKYQHGELRAQLQRATGERPPSEQTQAPPAGAPFIPLDSLKR